MMAGNACNELTWALQKDERLEMGCVWTRGGGNIIKSPGPGHEANPQN